jgi:methylenetetrahydrofolate--tRNA-(uracil-5-)-methyltransferase
MNVNFGLFPPMDDRIRRADRKKAYTARAQKALDAWLAAPARSAAE